MRLILATDSSEEPVTQAEAKAHLRVDSSDENDLIDSLITAARQAVEEYTGRVLVNQTWHLWLDRFPVQALSGEDAWWDGVKEGPISSINSALRHIEIPKSPLQSVTSLTTYDDDDAATVMSSSDYIVDPAGSLRGRITLKTGEVWPTDLRPANAIKIIFVAGYGSSAASVPDALKAAVKILVAHLFENREPVVTGTIATQLPFGVKTILAPYRMVKL